MALAVVLLQTSPGLSPSRCPRSGLSRIGEESYGVACHRSAVVEGVAKSSRRCVEVAGRSCARGEAAHRSAVSVGARPFIGG